MKAHHQHAMSPKSLRSRAEAILVATPRQIAGMPLEDVQKLVHELQVHQIELEMQNDELRRAQLELEHERNRYAHLYEFAPTAHLTLSASGEILEANLHAGELLALERGRLIGQKFSRFVLPEAQDSFYLLSRQVFNSDARQSTELELLNVQGKRLVFHLGPCAMWPNF
jgi:PAS domain-containing protein